MANDDTLKNPGETGSSATQPEARNSQDGGTLPDHDATWATPLRGGSSLPGPSGDLAGRRIGRYRLIEEIGAGGMGVVFKAQQDDPARIVAVKLLQTSRADDAEITRFRREAQILALLQHPGIAQVFETGISTDGPFARPYLAMEYLDGQTLAEVIERSNLDLSARLRLFRKICDAVQHAHHCGVVHRDLKPGNVLVVGDQPKVLDFGVARSSAPEVMDSLRTTPGELLGTVPYMAPEQTLGDPASVNARADQYALGLILFQLLTGRHAYDLPRSLPDALVAIREVPARKPSHFVASLRGDLDLIVATALSKDPARRYPSVGELSEDVRRYLENLPIKARPPSAFYLLGRFTKRHRTLVVATLAVLLTLVLGVVGTGLGLLEARAAGKREEALRKVAEADAAERDSVLKMLLAGITSAHPFADGPESKTSALLDVWADSVSSLRSISPELQIRIRIGLAYALEGIGNSQKTRQQLEIASRLAAANLPPTHPLSIDVRHLLGCNLTVGQDRDQGIVLLRSAVADLRKTIGPDDPKTQRAVADLARSLVTNNQFEEAEGLFRSIVKTGAQESDDDELKLLDYRVQLADCLRLQEKFDESLKISGRAREVLLSRHPPGFVRCLDATFIFAAGLVDSGRGQEALKILEPTIEAALSTHGAHPQTLDMMALATRAAEAASDASALLRASRQVVDLLGAEKLRLHPIAPSTIAYLADRVLRLEPHSIQGEVVGMGERIAATNSYCSGPVKARIVVQRAEKLSIDGEFEKAVDAFTVALDSITGLEERPENDLARARRGRGNALWRLGRLDEALVDFDAALKAWMEAAKRGEDLGVAVLRDLARLSRTSEGEAAGSILTRTLQRAESEFGSDHLITKAIREHGRLP